MSHNEIVKIEGLESLTNLEALWLDSNHISDVDGLHKLPRLKHLSLRNNRIYDIKGFEELNELQVLDLRRQGQRPDTFRDIVFDEEIPGLFTQLSDQYYNDASIVVKTLARRKG